MYNANYTVEQYTITRDRADAAKKWNTWDDQSERDVRSFGAYDDAPAFFDEVDVRQEWIGELLTGGSGTPKSKVMACELCRNEFDEDGDEIESIVVDYKEYGATDRRKELDDE